MELKSRRKHSIPYLEFVEESALTQLKRETANELSVVEDKEKYWKLKREALQEQMSFYENKEKELKK